MLLYVCAMALNAFVVLTCDCVSCHTHTSHTCHCEECALLEGETFLSQHCECTHSHENRTDTAVMAESERVLKLMKVVVAELPRTLADSGDTAISITHETPTCPQTVPLDDAPLLSAGGLRAPPIFA